MHDGWVRDITARILPTKSNANSQKAFADSIARLSRYVFGTSYGAYYRDLTDDRPFLASGAPPNLSVSAAELERWLFAEATQFEDRFSNTVGLLPALLAEGRHGTYRSSDGRLIAWVVDPASGFVQSDPKGLRTDWVERADFRRFTLDADIVIGAIRDKKTNYFAVVGQARTVQLDALPPLRYETMRRLAAASNENKSLAQSYERNHVLAGKLRQGHYEGWDWAPIYLSVHLQNTEFGSLLNITDQLLKSWSLGGDIEYFNFPYPQPGKFPFGGRLDKRVTEEGIQSEGTLFNWNTAGSSSIVEIGSYEYATLLRTGSLPITYGSEVDGDMETGGRLVGFEEEGWSYFSGLRDPNLTRVAQYTFFYQIFEDWAVAYDDRFDRDKLPMQQVNTAYRSIINRAVAKIQRGDFPPAILKELSDIPPSMQQILKDLVKEPLAELSSIISEFAKTAPDARETLVTAIIAPRDLIIDKTLGLKFSSMMRSSSRFGDLLKAAGPTLAESPDARATFALMISRVFDLSDLLKPYIDGAAAFDAGIAASDVPPEYGNVKTPSVVISRDTRRIGIGGHNLDSTIPRILGDPSVKRDTTRVKKRPDGEITIFVHPDNLLQTKELGRAAVRSRETDTLRLASELANKLDRSPSRTIANALSNAKPLDNPALGALRQIDQTPSVEARRRFEVAKENAERTLKTYNGSPQLMITRTKEGMFVVSGAPPPAHLALATQTATIQQVQRQLVTGKYGNSIAFTGVGRAEIDAISRSIANVNTDPTRQILPTAAGGGQKPPQPPWKQFTVIEGGKGPQRNLQIVTRNARDDAASLRPNFVEIAEKASQQTAVRKDTVESIPDFVRGQIPTNQKALEHYIVNFPAIRPVNAKKVSLFMGIVTYGKEVFSGGISGLNRLIALVAGSPPADRTTKAFARAFRDEVLNENDRLKLKIYFYHPDESGYTIYSDLRTLPIFNELHRG